MWWRATQGLRLVGDKWQIVHEHSSLPFDMATGKVSFALKPWSPRHEGDVLDEEDRHPASEGRVRSSLTGGRVSGIRNHTVASAPIATAAVPMKAAGLPNVSLM